MVEKEVYLVELIYRSANDDELKDVFEVSVKYGYADYDEKDEQWENFEGTDYDEQLFLSDSKSGFVFGKEIEDINWDEYDFTKWYGEEYFEEEDEAIKYAEDLITQLKNGDFNG